MNITGNTIFIPGATSGIGLALAPVAVGLPAAGAAAQAARRRDLDDAVHALEQFAVVARDHHHAAPGREPLAQPAPRIGIERLSLIHI